MVIVGVTESTNMEHIQQFRDAAGAKYPILHGLSADTKKAYGVERYPSVRVLAKDGSVAGTDEASIAKCVEAK